MRTTGLIKVGAASVAAGAGVILALTSVLAHTSAQPRTLHVPSKSVAASLMNTIEANQDSSEAADLLAREQAKAAKLAAELKHDAAMAAEEATESTTTETNEDSTSTGTVTETDSDNQTETDATEVDTDTDQTETQDATDSQDATDTQDTTDTQSGD